MCKAKPGLRCANGTRRRLKQASEKLAQAEQQFRNGSINRATLDDVRYEHTVAYVADEYAAQSRADKSLWSNELRVHRKMRDELVGEANRLDSLGHIETLDYSPAYLATTEQFREQADNYASAVAVYNSKVNLPDDMRNKAERTMRSAERAMRASKEQAEAILAQAMIMRADGESRLSSFPRATSMAVQNALEDPQAYWEDSPHDRAMSLSYQGRVVYIKDGPVAYGLDVTSDDEAQSLQDGVYGAGAGANDDTIALHRLTAASVAAPFRNTSMQRVLQKDITNALQLRDQARSEGKRNTVAAYTFQLRTLASTAESASGSGSEHWHKMSEMIRQGLRSSKPRAAVR